MKLLLVITQLLILILQFNFAIKGETASSLLCLCINIIATIIGVGLL